MCTISLTTWWLMSGFCKRSVDVCMRHEPRNKWQKMAKTEFLTQLHFFLFFLLRTEKVVKLPKKILFGPANSVQSTCSLVEIHNTRPVQVPVQQYYYLFKINKYFLLLLCSTNTFLLIFTLHSMIYSWKIQFLWKQPRFWITPKSIFLLG